MAVFFLLPCVLGPWACPVLLWAIHPFISLFGKSHIYETAAEHNLEVLANLPIDPLIREYVDNGRIYDYECEDLERLVEVLEKQ